MLTDRLQSKKHHQQLHHLRHDDQLHLLCISHMKMKHLLLIRCSIFMRLMHISCTSPSQASLKCVHITFWFSLGCLVAFPDDQLHLICISHMKMKHLLLIRCSKIMRLMHISCCYFHLVPTDTGPMCRNAISSLLFPLFSCDRISYLLQFQL